MLNTVKAFLEDVKEVTKPTTCSAKFLKVLEKIAIGTKHLWFKKSKKTIKCNCFYNDLHMATILWCKTDFPSNSLNY